MADVHIARFEQKPNVERKPDALAFAYGSWCIPELVGKLGGESDLIRSKVLKALGGLCAQSEHAGCAVRAGVVPAVLGEIGTHQELALALLLGLSTDHAGRQALLDEDALTKLYPLVKKREGMGAIGALCQNLCCLRDGADAVHRAGYVSLLSPALANGLGDDQAVWCLALAKMLRESSSALADSRFTVKADACVTFLKDWSLAKGEAKLIAGLKVLHALTVDDEHKACFVIAGAAAAVCDVLRQDGGVDDAPSRSLSWEARASLLSLLAQICVVVPGKKALVEAGRLQMLAKSLRGVDSSMLQVAAVQALIHVAEHPAARATLLTTNVEAELEELKATGGTPLVQRLAKSALELLAFTP